MASRHNEMNASLFQSFKEWLQQRVMTEKMHNPFGLLVLSGISIALAFVIFKFGLIPGVLAVGAMIGLPMVVALVLYPRFGLIVYLSLGYLIMWFFKLGVNFPLGTLMDGMMALFMLSFFIAQKKKPNWAIYKSPVTVMMLVWIIYNLLEVLNPTAESKTAWIYTVRTVAIVMFMYFIFVYYIDTKKFIKVIIKLWMGLALFAALYAIKQEQIGFFAFEENYLHSDPGIELLLFIGGVWRKFSIFSDPVAFSYNMVTASLMAIALLSSGVSKKKKIILYIMIMLFITAMLYSGTRGAYVLLPVALLLLAILKYNKKVIVILLTTVVLGVTLINIPTSNQTLFRFQSAFKPNDDASFNLRKMNQKKIQPYILEHPMGGGLGATGEWGKRFAPYSYLANFPPDSGYVRVAVELGWLGLFLFCALMFTIMRAGVLNYYSIRDPQLKAYCLGALLVVFALNFGNYPQEAIVQYPSNVYFYLVAALITVTKRLDQQQNEALCTAQESLKTGI